eukprot:jgi/Bigna1/138377/aug1.44_g13085
MRLAATVLTLMILTSTHTDLAAGTDTAERHLVNFVLLGATGDLSAKYLWTSLWKLYQDEEEGRGTRRLRVTAAARDEPEAGTKRIRALIHVKTKKRTERLSRSFLIM